MVRFASLLALIFILGCQNQPSSEASMDVSKFKTKQVEKVAFHTDFEEARQAAKLSGKPLLAYFTFDG